MGTELRNASEGLSSINVGDISQIDYIIENVQQIKFEEMESTKKQYFQLATIPYSIENDCYLNPRELRSRYENWYFIEPCLTDIPVHTKNPEKQVAELIDLWRNLMDKVYENIHLKREVKPEGYFGYTKSQNTNRGTFLLFRFQDEKVIGKMKGEE